jgi:hypothetical protein
LRLGNNSDAFLRWLLLVWVVWNEQ